jgi:hypothetical protein
VAPGRTDSVSGTGALGLREFPPRLFRGADREWSTSDFGIYLQDQSEHLQEEQIQQPQ